MRWLSSVLGIGRHLHDAESVLKTLYGKVLFQDFPFLLFDDLLFPASFTTYGELLSLFLSLPLAFDM